MRLLLDLTRAFIDIAVWHISECRDERTLFGVRLGVFGLGLDFVVYRQREWNTEFRFFFGTRNWFVRTIEMVRVDDCFNGQHIATRYHTWSLHLGKKPKTSSC